MTMKWDLNKLESELESVREAERAFKMKAGQFDEHLKEFLREHGVPEQGHLLDIIKTFAKPKSQIITV